MIYSCMLPESDEFVENALLALLSRIAAFPAFLSRLYLTDVSPLRLLVQFFENSAYYFSRTNYARRGDYSINFFHNSCVNDVFGHQERA